MRTGHSCCGVAFLDAVGVIRNATVSRWFSCVFRKQVNRGGMSQMTVRVIKVPKLLSGLVRLVMSIFGYRP